MKSSRFWKGDHAVSCELWQLFLTKKRGCCARGQVELPSLHPPLRSLRGWAMVGKGTAVVSPSQRALSGSAFRLSGGRGPRPARQSVALATAPETLGTSVGSEFLPCGGGQAKNSVCAEVVREVLLYVLCLVSIRTIVNFDLNASFGQVG